MKTLWIYLGIITFAFLGCGGGSSSKSTTGSESINGTIPNWSSFCSSIGFSTSDISVKAVIYTITGNSSTENYQTDISNQCVIGSDGSFSLTFETPASSYLLDVSSFSVPAGCERTPASGVSELHGNIGLWLYQGNTNIGFIRLQTNDGSTYPCTIGSLTYVTGNMTIKTITDAPIAYDESFIAGWNWELAGYSKKSTITTATSASLGTTLSSYNWYATANVPLAPTNVSASNASTTSAQVTWPSVSNATSYNIYYSTTSGAGTSGTKITGVTSPYTVAGLTSGATYYFVVTAANSYGESGTSSQMSVNLDAIPNAPTGVTSTVSSIASAQISWSSGAAATSYNIYYSTTSGAGTSGTKIAGVTSPYTVAGLTEGTIYYFVVTAANSYGESGASIQVSAIPGKIWNTVGAANFSAGKTSSTSIAIDSNGTPYVAYGDGNKSGYASVMKYNGTSWVTVGIAGFSAGVADNTRIAIDSTGTPYVAYKDGGNSSKATVMKYNGTSWVTVGTAGFSAGEADYISLAISNGTPYVAYEDGNKLYKATVMKYNGTSWVTVGSAGFSADVAVQGSIAIASDGTPYVVYSDSSRSWYATVMKYNGTNWTTVGSVGFSAGRVYNTSMAIDSTGTPYVAYSDDGNSGKATMMKYNGTSWVTVGAAGFSAGTAYTTSMAIDSTDTPYIFYGDGSNSYKATVMKYSGTGWTTVGTAGFSAGEADYTSIAIYNGTPYAAYEDYTSGKATVKIFQ